MKTILNKASIFSIVIIAIVTIHINTKSKITSDYKNIIRHDVIYYYQYLPALIHYHDLSFEFAKDDPDLRKTKFWIKKTKEGKFYNKTSMGMSFLYAPFYLIAELQAKLTHKATDGFSYPYVFWLLYSSLVYVLIGFVFLRKLLLQYFSDWVTSITILLLYFGTNLFYYTSFSAPMPHAYLFFLFSIFAYYTIKWHKNPSIKNSIIVGLSLSLISLIRPTDSLVILFFIFYDITSIGTLKKKFYFFLSNWKMVLLIAALSLTFWIPQIIYWKIITGDLLYFSYGKERFFFGNPKILESLFSYRKGWFVYSPIMLFAILSIFLLRGHLKKFLFPLLLFVIINIYVVSSWWCWWYGGGFGNRVYIESFALLAIPLAFFVSLGFKNRLWIKIVSITLGLMLIGLQSFQVEQYRNHLLHHDAMTKKAYWTIFLKETKPKDYWKLLEYPDYGSCVRNNDFDTKTRVLKKDKINIKVRDKYLSSDLHYNGEAFDFVENNNKWELFYLEYLENGCVQLKNTEDNYLYVGKDDLILSNNPKITIYTTFLLEEIDKTHFRIKTVDDKYFSINSKTKQILVTDDDDFEKSIFEFIIRN